MLCYYLLSMFVQQEDQLWEKNGDLLKYVWDDLYNLPPAFYSYKINRLLNRSPIIPSLKKHNPNSKCPAILHRSRLVLTAFAADLLPGASWLAPVKWKTSLLWDSLPVIIGACQCGWPLDFTWAVHAVTVRVFHSIKKTELHEMGLFMWLWLVDLLVICFHMCKWCWETVPSCMLWNIIVTSP